jgi:hypothetical protein
MDGWMNGWMNGLMDDVKPCNLYYYQEYLNQKEGRKEEREKIWKGKYKGL